MQQLSEAIAQILQDAPTAITLSSPRDKTAAVQRASLRPVKSGWQLERRTATQVFHENIAAAALAAALLSLLQTEFTQLAAKGQQFEHSLRITAKGRVLTSRKAGAGAAAAPLSTQHNRQKNRLLPEGEIIPPLVDMGVFTAEGRVAAPMQDKYRQINRFVELVDDALKDDPKKKLNVVDFGCGKSYLTFVLYHYFTRVKGIEVEMTGLDLKADVVARCNAAAEKYGYQNLRFMVGDIAEYTPGGAVDMVITLHACDTATDLALAHAVRWGTTMIFSVPCCQHELNSQIHSDDLAILTRYGLIKERVAALMTDALRANLLTACGYKTQLVEFVDFEHTPKNILIRARRTGLPLAHRKQALAEAQRLEQAFSLDPALHRLLAKPLAALEKEK